MTDERICIRPRHVRALGVANGEAFQIMLYRSNDGAAPDLWVWNSRDGVTPFGMRIDGAEYFHAMNDYRPVYSAVLPLDVDFVWVDYSRETWAAMQRKNYERFAARPDDEADGGIHFRARYPTVEAWLKVTPFEHGQPRRVTVEEYLAETSSWIGGYPDAPRVPMRTEPAAA